MIKNIAELEEKINDLKKRISRLEYFFKSPDGKKRKINNYEIYKRIAKEHFKNKKFTNQEIKEVAKKNGVINRKGEQISDSYNRCIISELKKRGILINLSRNYYCFNKNYLK